MNDDYDIPPDLARQALKKLGRFRRPVRDLVRRVDRIRWLARGGQREPWDSEVVRIWDVEEAKVAEKRLLRAITMAVWTCLESVGKTVGRYEQMIAAEEYWIARHDWPDDDSLRAYARHSAQIRSDIVGALREIVLDDVISIRYYHEAIDWYEKGHWRCAIDESGRRVVY